MQLSQYRQTRIEKLNKIISLGLDAWPCKARRTHSIVKILTENYNISVEQLENNIQEVSVMGRIITIREMGKSVFMHLTEDGQKLQIYIRMNDLQSIDWELVKLLDMGDFISVTGPLMKTKTGELSIRVKEIQFLCKAHLPLPDKWHGLQDKETRYRQRYLDLISNPETLKIFQMRSKIISKVRQYMETMGFLEVETPMMQPIPGGATAKPFMTHYNALDMSLYLRIAPELYLKRLIVGGFSKVFEINRSFRNEGISVKHNPEFTMMESYSTGDDLRDVMVLVEDLFQNIAQSCGDIIRPWGSINQVEPYMINYKTPFRRLTMKGAIAQYGNIDILALEDPLAIQRIALEAKLEDVNNKSIGVLIGELFEHYAESHLIQPTFITEYPVELSPLTKALPDNPNFVDRFELFIGGMEIANAYSELNDPIVQVKRFNDQILEENSKNKNEYSFDCKTIDYDFINSLEHGLPPTGGLGVGLDRMTMLMTNSSSIRDVILFPFMRPLAPNC